MAQLSPTMEEGKLIEWKVKEGDEIAQGDIVAEIETDKANMDVEALGGGVLRKIFVQPGQTVPVGALIGVIAAPDEAIDDLVAAAATEAASTAANGAPVDGAASNEATADVAPTHEAPAAEQTQGVEPPAVEPSAVESSAVESSAVEPAPSGQPSASAEAVARTTAGGERLKVSPVARRIAAEHGLDLATVTGSGPGGRVIKADVESGLGAP
ncbi:MAG: biotin/lipoyl-containing protein, partial [Gemmatimonadota bacterium]